MHVIVSKQVVLCKGTQRNLLKQLEGRDSYGKGVMRISFCFLWKSKAGLKKVFKLISFVFFVMKLFLQYG